MANGPRKETVTINILCIIILNEVQGYQAVINSTNIYCKRGHQRIEIERLSV